MIATFPIIVSVEDSRVSWIGKIPSHWEVKRLKFVCQLETGHTPSRSEESYWIPEECTIPWVSLNDTKTLAETDYISDTKYKISPLGMANSSAHFIDAGAVVFTRDATIGLAAITTVPMAVSQHIIAWVCLPIIHNKYLLYVIYSMGKELDRLTMGATLKTIGMADVKELATPLPPLEEQKSIAQFLDRKTAAIDALIAKKQRLIELLEEKRSALINQAVTKGLNSDTSMKDSGIPWIGYIPEHWTVNRLGFISSSLQTGPFGSQLHAGEYTENGIPIINPINIQAGKIIPDYYKAVDEKKFLELSRHKLKAGDLVFARRGELGRCGLVEQEGEGWLCGTGSIRVRLKESIAYPEYINSFVKLSGVASWLSLESVGSTMDNLNTGILSRLPVPLPPYEEQVEIFHGAKSKVKQLVALIKTVYNQIEKLQEYRQSVITAAVTGKLDVTQDAVP